MKKKPSRRRTGRRVEKRRSVRSPSHFLPALSRLGETLLAGRARQEDPWMRAATFSDLTLLGLSSEDCGLLISQKLLAARNQPRSRRAAGRDSRKQSPALSASGRGEGAEAFSRRGPRTQLPAIGPRTRFILTDAGLTYLMKHVTASRLADGPAIGAGDPFRVPLGCESAFGRGQAGATSLNPASAAPPNVGSDLVPLSTLAPSSPPLALCPYYDRELRELNVAGETILRLHLQARNLAKVLTALQLADWKPRVSHPLNGHPAAGDPQPLIDVVYGLNHRQSLIEFRTDGTAIRWQWRNQKPIAARTPKRKAARVSRSRKAR